jgi:hypothetical protein
MNNYAILVNTTDSFEDCWIPFFTLFKKFWPGYNGLIYLNTETKSFNYPGLNIVSLRNNKNSPEKNITWSQCMSRALDIIDNDIVLYLQEDYFLKDFVKADTLEHYASLMKLNNIDCIHLTDQNSTGPFHPSDFDGLSILDVKAPNLISCQAAFWKKEVLRAYLRKDESGWQFETYGTKRARLRKHNFYSVDRDIVKLNKFELVPYVFTGIVKGKWLPEVVDLFEQNKIVVDFKKRGFITDDGKPTFKKKLLNYIKRKPKEFSSWLDLLKLKLKIAK